MSVATNPIPALVEAAVANAANYAQQCEELIATQGLSAALARCRELKVDPPTCSLSAQTLHAEKMRWDAARKLSEPRWWVRRLRVKAVQDFEAAQWAQGKVTNYVSDEMFDYMKSRRR